MRRTSAADLEPDGHVMRLHLRCAGTAELKVHLDEPGVWSKGPDQKMRKHTPCVACRVYELFHFGRMH